MLAPNGGRANAGRRSACRRGSTHFDMIEFGAGDGIRTHDPNLGKVVLYP